VYPPGMRATRHPIRSTNVEKVEKVYVTSVLVRVGRCSLGILRARKYCRTRANHEARAYIRIR